MAHGSKSSPAKSTLPARRRTPTAAAELLELFGQPALLNGENREQYDAVYQSVRTALMPMDVIEEIWVGDFTELNWQVLRLRRLKASYINREVAKHLKETLNDLGYEDEERDEQETEDELPQRGDPGYNDSPRYEPTEDPDSDDEDHESNDVASLVYGWINHRASAVKRLTEILKDACLDLETIAAEALVNNLGEVERLDRMITQADFVVT